MPSEWEAFVNGLVASRKFLSLDEVVAEGLQLLKARESLRSDLEVGYDQAERGELVDGPEALVRVRRLVGIADSPATKP